MACFNLAGVLPKTYHGKREMLNKRRLRYELNFVLRGITEEDYNTPRDILKARDPEKYEYIYRTKLPDHPRTADAWKRDVLYLKAGKLQLNKPGFTLDDLAKELGISRRTLYRRYRNELPEIRKICPIVRKRDPLIGSGKRQNVS
jgi:AraC-like DNA-binding protein